MRCETRSSEADDPPPFECRLRLDTPRGPLLFIRAPGEGSGVSYLGRQLWLRDGAVHLSGGAARLR